MGADPERQYWLWEERWTQGRIVKIGYGYAYIAHSDTVCRIRRRYQPSLRHDLTIHTCPLPLSRCPMSSSKDNVPNIRALFHKT